DFGIVPLEAQACGTPVVALARGGALETVVDGKSGVLFTDATAAALAQALERVTAMPIDRDEVRRHAERFARDRHVAAMRDVTDALLASWAFVLAYGIRFESGLIAAPKGQPPLGNYINVLPFVALLTPLAFQIQGVYRLRRGRSRVDDFFAVLIGSIIAVVFGVVVTLYVSVYYVSPEQKAQGFYEVSQVVWGIFLVLNVLFAYLSREIVREALERRWRAGVGLKRILIAGAGDLGRMVADRMLQHREFGFQVVGLVDDRAGGDHIGYRGIPLLGTLAEAGEIAQRERVDHLYVALPLEEHTKLLDL